MLTARAENFLHGQPDLDDTIKRLQAFEKAGADVLYAPGLPNLEAIQQVCAAVSKPVNILANGAFTLQQLAEAGAKRVSVGSRLNLAALGAFNRGALEMKQAGTFNFARDVFPYGEINNLMKEEVR
jgi:2-methylisocitrate lyase-like PEP mutase family enzyme